MMRQRAPVPDEALAIRPAHEAIEQTVPMDVAGLRAAKEEPNPAESMGADAKLRPRAHAGFNRADAAETGRAKQSCQREQQRVENLRRAGDFRQPSQPPNGERKNQVSLFSTGARSATDGPFSTLPSASKREP